MKPYTDNVIFWDSEFTDLDPYKGEILSLAFVKSTGEELYLEVEHTGEVSEWVKEHVLPTLTQPKVSKAEAIKQMTEFFGPNRPFLVAYVNQFDTIYLYKMMGTSDSTKKYPFHWIQVDFASMLFASGIDPERFNIKHKDTLLRELGLNLESYQQHNALDDAKLLRDSYIKLINTI